MSVWSNDKDVYKSSSKTTGEEKRNSSSIVLGIREHNIIRYALLCNEFRLCELVEYYHRGAKGKERSRLFNKYYCALLRLIKRGYVVKVSRGVYRLVKAPTSVKVIDTRNGIKRRKFRGEEKLGGRAGADDSIFASSEDILGLRVRNSCFRRYRLRLHSVVKTMHSDDLARVLYLRILFVHRFTGLLLKDFKKYLSRRECRRISRLVNLMLSEVVYNNESAKVGVHRLYFGRSSATAPNDGLYPLHFMEGVPVRASEVGVDVVFTSRIDFRELLNFSKIYVEDLGRVDRVEVPLVSSVRG